MNVNSFTIHLFSSVLISALFARSVGVITGKLGLISLAQMSFAAVSAWCVSYLSLGFASIHFIILVLIGAFVAAIAGATLGFLTQRIRGVELAALTLGFAATGDLLLKRNGFPGTSVGQAVTPGGALGEPFGFLTMTVTVFLIVTVLLGLLQKTRLGLSFEALRESDRAAHALGINVPCTKIVGFSVAAFIAGVGGGLLTGQYGLISTELFTPLASMMIFVTGILAGASIASGAFLGGVFVVLLPEIIRRLGLPADFANVILAIGAFDVLRRGKGGIAEQLKAWIVDQKFKNTVRQVEFLRPLPTQGDLALADHSRRAEALTVQNLSFFAGKTQILDSINLSLPQGEVHAIVGANGAGKTTLIDAVSGFLPGIPAVKNARRTFRQTRSFQGMSVEEYLKVAGASSKLTGELSEYFALPMGKLPLRLMDVASRRVLEIVGALATSPTIILLDEPAAGMTSDEKIFLSARIKQIPKHFGATVVVVEHDLDFVKSTCSTITVMSTGRILLTGATQSVLNNASALEGLTGVEQQ